MNDRPVDLEAMEAMLESSIRTTPGEGIIWPRQVLFDEGRIRQMIAEIRDLRERLDA